MKIISFAWTTDALLAGRKTVTRRDWKPSYAYGFRNGDLVAAYDRSPRVHGRQVATIEITEEPVYSHEFPDEDYEGEGMAWMEEQGQRIRGVHPREWWERWKTEAPGLWVVRFRLVSK